MAIYAVIQNDVVINVIDAETIDIALEATGMECVECDRSFWIGWKRQDGQWIAPSPTE